VSVEPSAARRGRIAVALVGGLLVTLLIAVLLVPVILRGEPPSPLEFLVAAGEALAIGFLLRTRSSERLQSVGFAILVLGLLAVGGAVTVMWIALGSCC
jgi:hypothetical protein